MLEVASLVLRWVLSPFLWAWKAWRMLKELRTHEQQILAARELLVRELLQNAQLVEEYDQGKWGVGHLQTMFRSERWQQGATEWSALRRSNEALWNEIADAYEAMDRVRTMGGAATPPTSAQLSHLAERLSEAKI
jgi:hypothetical protein